MRLGVSSSQELFDLIPIVGIYAWDDISKYFKNNFTKKDDKNYTKLEWIQGAFPSCLEGENGMLERV